MELHPDRRILHHTTFVLTERSLRELLRSLDKEIRNIVENENALSRQLHVLKTADYRILRELLRLFDLIPVQELRGTDFNTRMHFCQFLQDGLIGDTNFLNKLFLIDR